MGRKVIPDCGRQQLGEGVSQVWLKFMARVRSGRMEKGNVDGQLAREVWGGVQLQEGLLAMERSEEGLLSRGFSWGGEAGSLTIHCHPQQ